MGTKDILNEELNRLQRLNIVLEKNFLGEKNIEPELIVNSIRQNSLAMCEIVRTKSCY